MGLRWFFQRLVAAAAFALALACAVPAAAQSTCAPAAAQGTAPASWQTYCWLNFSALNTTQSRSASGQNFSFGLNDGSTLTFNLRISGANVAQRAAPSWSGAAVGNTAFLGIPGSPVVYQTAGGTTTMQFTGIAITPAPGASAVSVYSFVAADAESSNNGESLRFVTNGAPWTVLDQVPPISGNNYPSISGAGTTQFDVGGRSGTVGAYIAGSNSPTSVTITMVGGGLQGTMFAVRFASMRLAKEIVGTRVAAADQFAFDIRTSGGAPLASGTTSGTSLGPFAAAAVSLASGISLRLTETMAPGSASALGAYDSRLTCTNDTAGSSTPLPNNLATTDHLFGTLQFGDAIQCRFRNTPRPHLALSKALGSGGRRFSSDQFTLAINQGSTVVASTTTTGTGTGLANHIIPLTQVTAGAAHSLTEAAAGSTSLAQYDATMACTNANPASATALPSGAGGVPGVITPVLGDVISCTITNSRRATNVTLAVAKTSAVVNDPVNGTVNPMAIPGAAVQYAISVANSGNGRPTSGSIFIVDNLPSAVAFDNGVPVTFVQGTPTSALTFSASTNVRFANTAAPPANFAACTYAPTSGVDPAVRHICIQPSGRMAAASSSGQPNFTIRFTARVQ